jgi:D-citramalate synthase
MPSNNIVQVMDTTLRDGEQTPDVSYTPPEKLHLARLLLSEVEVDRIEIASTRVSEGELEAARRVVKWARGERILDRIEILGYCDGRASVDWMAKAGARVMNLLVKGSEEHCRMQLRQSPADHRAAAAHTLANAKKKRIKANCYLEDWSNGVRDSFDYVFAMVETLLEARVQRIYLADTLGIFSPDDVTRYVGLMTATWPEISFEFHAHNDYGLATANCLAAVRAGARGVHTSVNGMGERSGNTRLPEVVATLHDHTEFRTRVNEKKLGSISRLVETFSGKDVSANSPIVGRDVFTQTAGIHADGDAKGDLYESRLAPGRFGQRRRYALGKLSGKASIDHNLKSLGIELIPKNRQLVLQRVIELGDKKHTVAVEDLPYIIADVLKTPDEQLVRVDSYEVTVATGSIPEARVTLTYRRQQASAKATGDGGYDAFMNAVSRAAKTLGLSVARLTDYRVRIPPGGQTAALVQTLITWQSAQHDEGTFSTLGVDPDQLGAAVIATEKMLNALATRKKPAGTRKKPARKKR